MGGRIRDGVDEQREAGGDRDGAAPVRGRLPVHLALVHVAGREHEREDPDRDVDEEDPLPARVLGEHAASEHADRGAGATDRSPDAERLVAFGAFGERGHDDRQRRRRDQRGAEPLHGTRGDQDALRPGQAAEERGDGEDDDADQEDAEAAEVVGGATAEQQEPAEGDGVGGDHPLQVRLAEVERTADRRQRDVDDRHVEHGHEERRADDREHLPAVRIRDVLQHAPDANYANGLGVAETFGIETRAIVENSCGRQAWQIPASHATERKTNASSIVKPH